jgi:hypothetical protein
MPAVRLRHSEELHEFRDRGHYARKAPSVSVNAQYAAVTVT